MPRLRHVLALALVLAACRGGTNKSGPLVAKGDGVAVTAAEFQAALDRQSRAIPTADMAQKKELLDRLVRIEVLAREAERRGLDKDPDVQLALRQLLLRKLQQAAFPDADPAKEVSEADARKYYDEHKDEYQKPKRVRLAQVFFAAGPKDRAAKATAAKKALSRIRSEEKKNPAVFAAVARELSDDAASKQGGGDLGYRSREELEKQLGTAAAAAAFALKDGEVSQVLESPQGFHVLKLTGRQEEVNLPFETARTRIQFQMYRERRGREQEEFVKKLVDQAKVTVYDAELEKLTPARRPGVVAPGQMPTVHPAPPPAAAPPAAPHAAPAPAPAPAPAK